MPHSRSSVPSKSASASTEIMRTLAVRFGFCSLVSWFAGIACSAPNESNGAPPSSAGSGGSQAGAASSAMGGQSSSGGTAPGFGGVQGQAGSSGGSTLMGSSGAASGQGGSGGMGPPSSGGTISSGGVNSNGGANSQSGAGGSIPSAGRSGVGGTASGGRGSGGAANGGNAGASSGGANSGGKSSTAGGTAGSGGSTNTGPLTIWIAGDSTVQNCSSSCPCGWGSQIQALFSKDVTITNSAIGGRSVRSWLYSKTLSTADANGECDVQKDSSGNPQWSDAWTRMTSTNGIKRGDYLFIQFGINDGARTCDTQGAEGRHVGIEAFKSSYAMMAEAAHSRGASAIFVTPVSAISCSGSTAQGTRGAYVTATIDAGRENGVPVIDLHAASIALYNRLKFCPIPGGDNEASFGTGEIGAFFCKDHTHFEAQGAAQIAGLVTQGLRDLNHPLAAYLK
ncbi:MAG TPA: GDSL-type esterase/lipase family protein [Polyangiaceae bacterium]|nr:GDSL-type esterase/lipase family protein [Polyangiaceae bacterium]